MFIERDHANPNPGFAGHHRLVSEQQVIKVQNRYRIIEFVERD
jgi:hypothetical protein